MKFRGSLLTLCLVATTALGAACGGDGSDGSDDGESSPGSVTGIVTEIESEGLNEVTSFKLKADDEVYEILIDEDVIYGFPLGHLEEHRIGALPVEVELEERGGELYAAAIEDA